MPKRIYRYPRVAELTGGLTTNWLRQLEDQNLFPKRFKLSPLGGKFGAVGWPAEEVDSWVMSRIASRDEQTAA